MTLDADDIAVLDWRPAVLELLAAFDGQLSLGSWEIVPADGTEPLRSTQPSVVGDHDAVDESMQLALPDGSVFATLKTVIDLRETPDRADHLAAMANVIESLVRAHHAANTARVRAQLAEEAAVTDVLTGLYNTRAWHDALRVEEARAARNQSVALVAAIDLDDLKRVNDAQGHLGGDMLLKLTAQRLRAAVRTEDVVARVGGDEFCVMAVDYKPPEAKILVERLRSELEEAGIYASIGAVVRSTDESLSDAAHRADLEMYRDKARRKGNC